MFIGILTALLIFVEGKTIEVPKYEIKDSVYLNPKETALLVIDMQYDFAHPKGNLYVPSTKDVIPKIKELLRSARKAGVLVIYTQDWHTKNDPEFKIWPVHAVRNTMGAEIIKELKPKKNELRIKKMRYDAFYGTSLDYILRTRGIKNVIIVGTVSNICVLETASSAAMRWYKVILPIDCIAPLSDFGQELTIWQVYFLYKGTITKSKAIHFSE